MTPRSSSQAQCGTRLREIEDRLRFLDHLAHLPVAAGTPGELAEYERQVGRTTEQLAGLITGEILQASLASETVEREVETLVKASTKPLKKEGMQRVTVRTASGVVAQITTVYYRRKGQRGTKRRLPGLYAGLVVLGIFAHCTPALAARVSLLAAALSAFAEAQRVLRDEGVELNIKTVRAIAYAFAQRARAIELGARQLELGHVAGRQVVISCDGGRLRIRTKKRGPRTKKGRCRYHAVWCEPKLFVISVVGPDGRQEHTFTPLIEATLAGPDALFDRLEIALKRVHIEEAKRVLFVADGARWIWTRVQRLCRRLGLAGMVELLDFFHVVEHLGAVAELKKSWSTAQRRRWVKQQRQRLRQGHAQAVVQAVDQLCRGPLSKAVRTQRDYFVRNLKRLDYAAVKAAGLPLGSGAVESAVRRVINLRLKGASIYWLKPSAEAMLMLRSYFKAGRWNLLKTMANPSFMPAFT
jgi:hypothetical protein